jgi:hypothetical protein
MTMVRGPTRRTGARSDQRFTPVTTPITAEADQRLTSAMPAAMLENNDPAVHRFSSPMSFGGACWCKQRQRNQRQQNCD